jgi:hypothetical protein
MESLETLDLCGDLEPSTTEFVERNFNCPKVTKLIIGIEYFEYPGFFKKFPNLRTLHYYRSILRSTMDSAIQNCPKIESLIIPEIDDAFENATFLNLAELKIDLLQDQFKVILETFLLRHQNLSYLNFNFEVKAEFLWKLPTLLPILKKLRIRLVKKFGEADLKKALSISLNFINFKPQICMIKPLLKSQIYFCLKYFLT